MKRLEKCASEIKIINFNDTKRICFKNAKAFVEKDFCQIKKDLMIKQWLNTTM